MQTLAQMKASVTALADIDPTEVSVLQNLSPRDALVARTGLATASPYQIDVFQHVSDQIQQYQANEPTKSLAVSAVAGSGKTTTIVAAANLIPTSLTAIFLAFNKSIADELDERLPGHVRAKTLNSLGFGMLFPYLKGIGIYKPDVRGSRTQSIIRKAMDFKQQDLYGKDVKFLVNMCKSMGVIPVGVNDGVGINGQSATDAVLSSICVHHGRMIDVIIRPTVFAKVREILAISFSDSNIYNTGIIDYDDQKWLTVCKRPNGRSLANPMYDVVIVDEVQDVNSVDIEMIRMVLKPNGIVIGVGDTNQAIYGFRGADTTAFETFVSSFKAKTLPLSITYRCGTALVQHAQELVPTIQAAPNAVAGEVAHLAKWDAMTFQPTDLVLCRNNAPLIEFAYKLIKAKVPVYVKGRNLGDNLIGIINNCVAEKTWVPNPNNPGKKMPVFSCQNVRVTALVTALRDWMDKQGDLIRQEDPDDEAAVQRVTDQFDSIMVFIHANTNGMVQSVIEEIESLFSDDDISGAVICATIHKAKGLEANRVFMYRNDLMYPQYAVRGTWQYGQEDNLNYVARTRGKVLYAYLAGK